MSQPDDHLEIGISSGDTVVLSRSALEPAWNDVPEIVAYIHGESDSFPAFEVPLFEGEQGVIEVEPGVLENRGYDGGAAQSRLFHFAHLVRPFPWMDDPRGDYLNDLVNGALTPDGAGEIQVASTQDLWDALFTFARGERFVDGLIASRARELTLVANTIRERLLSM